MGAVFWGDFGVVGGFWGDLRYFEVVGGVIGEVWGGFRVVGVLNFGVVLEDFGVVERFWG